MTINKTASLLVTLIASIVILIYGQSLLIPFVFASLLWILVREIKQVMDKNRILREYFASWLKSLIITLILISLLVLIAEILIANSRSLAKSYVLYQANVSQIADQIDEFFDIDINEYLLQQREELNFAVLFSGLLNTVTSLLGSTFMILIYALFIFLEEANFSKKMKFIFKSEEQYNSVVDVLERIEDSVTQYLGLKVLVSGMTGILSYIVLLFIGIDGPAFWAFLIFLLNFIPTIGSLIATLFPAVFSLLQFGEFFPALLILIFVGAIQLLVGNIIEPRIMGKSLNISSLVAIMALMFWGAIWGITGMLLSIPITVIIVIVLSQFPQTRNIAIMLSKDGKLS